MHRHTATLAVLFLCLPLTVAAETIHVPGDQPTIQAGIDAAVDGDTVLVADGTYTGDGNRNIDFNGKAITVRSENGAVSCIIDCQGSETDQHRGFYFHNGEGPESVVEGFTVQNGYNVYGGAIHCDVNTSPSMISNILKENIAEFGGAVFMDEYSSPVISGNII